MFTQDEILIGLSPSFLRIAARRGKGVERVERVPLDPAAWAETWTQGLRPLDMALSNAMAALKVRPGAAARVVYSTPDTMVDVCSVPARGQAALTAADLALRETLRDATGRLTVMSVLSAHAGDGPKAAPRSHVMIAAESAAHAETLGALLTRAGLRSAGLVPTKAVLIQSAVREAAKLPAEGAQALAYLGDHATILAARVQGRLQFARIIDLGYGQLAETLVRAAAATGKPFDRLQAYRLLFTVGVPRRGQVIDAAIGLKADNVLPMMQSILQRFIVETRQSLRFGLPEGDLARATIHLTGPGCDIPGLGELFASELDWPVTRRDPETVNGKPLDAVGNDEFGELIEAANAPASAGVLHPPSVTARRTQRTLQRAFAVGAGIAVLAAAGGWWNARRNLAAVELEFAALSPRTAAIQERRDLREQAVGLSGELTGALRLARGVTNDRPGWAATLGAISRLTDETIELSELQGTYPKEDSAPPTATLRGSARPGAKADTDSLGEFLNRLSRCPLVESARIVSTRTERANGVEVRQFVVEAELRTLPVISAAAKEGTP